MDILPYGRHQLDDDDIAAVVDVLKNGALTCGPQIEAFERAFAAKVGAKEAIVCSNGTAALHMAALTVGLGVGDIAIVPTLTFLSTANAVRMTGADVVFADVDPETGLLTGETLRDAYARTGTRVKAVLPVHLNGQCADMEEISRIAAEHNSQIITDCCHALGAEYYSGGAPGDGKFETLACFSLHPVKSIAMGEGGFVTTNNSEYAARIRHLRGHDMKRNAADWILDDMAFDQQGGANPWFYEMHELAYNYRATDMQCALGHSQLKKLDQFVARRREIAALYDTALKSLGNKLRPVAKTSLAASAWHLYPVLIDFAALGLERGPFMRELMAKGVGSQVHYIPVSSQPYYRDLYGQQAFAGAEAYYQRVLSLPIFPAMTDSDVLRVVAALETLLN